MTHDAETEARKHYAAIRADVLAGKTVTVLHIGPDRTVVATGSGAEPDAVLVLQIGSRKTATKYFRHDPPTPDELENAITAVEDALMPVRAMIAEGSMLYTMDAGMRELAQVAGVASRKNPTVSRDAVEHTFNRLAAVSLGRPAAREGLPEGGTFAATLLILRECMHHVGFKAMAVRAGEP